MTKELKKAEEAVDHLVLGVANLEAGIAWVEQLTGVRATPGGKHPGGGTHNALLSLGGRRYLEIIAPDPEQPGIIGRFGDLSGLETPKLVTWAAVTNDVRGLAERARSAGYEIAELQEGSRARPDGRVLKWTTMSLRHDLGGVIPFFIEWGEGVTHPSEDSPKGCVLEGLTLRHPQPERVRQVLAAVGIEARVEKGEEAGMATKLNTLIGKCRIGS